MQETPFHGDKRPGETGAPRIRAIGAFAIETGGRPIQNLSRKAKALIGYLALAEGSCETRERLVGLLWSESEEERARASLRQTLYEIREVLAPFALSGLAADKQTVALAWTAHVDALDAIAAAKAGAAPFAAGAAGDFAPSLLADLDGVDPAFDEWLAARRGNFRTALAAHLETALRAADAGADKRGAAARALFSLDPAHEEAARALMRARAAAGDAGAALGIYKALWERLANEFDVEPSEETQKLAAEIKLAQPFTGKAPESVAQPSVSAAPPDPTVASREAPLSSREGPSLAVLPFINMSGDPEQEYFADGITEEIITALSRVKWFFVIARNSSFTYKGRAVDVRQVGRELGVRYVLEGSVRKAGNRLRITGQLVEAETGRHVWAEKFDGGMDDVFALQDRVADSVAAAIEPSVRHAEIVRSRQKPTENLDAYDFVLRALPNIIVIGDQAGNNNAVSNLRKAIALDPNYAQAHAFLAMTHAIRIAQGWSSADDDAEGRHAAAVAVTVQSDDPVALAYGGFGLAFIAGRVPEGLTHTERAYAINPNSSRVLLTSGWVNFYADRDEIAIDRIQRISRLSPIDPELPFAHCCLAYCNFSLRRYEEGIAAGRRSIAEAPGLATGYRALIVNLVEAGRLEEAKGWMAALTRFSADPTNSSMRPLLKSSAYRARYKSALRSAGAPGYDSDKADE